MSVWKIVAHNDVETDRCLRVRSKSDVDLGPGRWTDMTRNFVFHLDVHKVPVIHRENKGCVCFPRCSAVEGSPHWSERR